MKPGAAATNLGNDRSMQPCSTSLVTLSAIAMTGAIAAAQPADGPAPSPVTSSSTCSVDIVRAPDDVRAVVERWVRDEPRCISALEVRIVRTDGGLYVLARDDRGRAHERVVPDATTAAVLITSWAADDTIVPRAPAAQGAALMAVGPAVAATPPREPGAAPAARVASTAPDRDGVSRAIEPPGVVPPSSPHPPAAPSYTRWIGLGGLMQVATTGANTGSEAHGGRADIDLWATGHSKRWVTGVALAVVRVARSGYNFDGDTVSLRSLETSAAARVGFAARSGRWEVAPSIAAGFLYTRADVYTSQISLSTNGISAIGQLALTVSFRIDTHLAITAGSIVTAYMQQLAAIDVNLNDVTRNGDVMMLVGLRWGL
jgi:hypothetical protein